MSIIYFKCGCENEMEVYLAGEGFFNCSKCERKYSRWYNPKTEAYEFEEMKSLLDILKRYIKLLFRRIN